MTPTPQRTAEHPLNSPADTQPDAVAQSSAERWVHHWDAVAMFVARASVIVSLVYATWQYGSVRSETLYRVAAVVMVGLLASAAVTRIWIRRSHAMPNVLVALLLAWLIYAGVQATPGNALTQWWFARGNAIASEFRDGSDELVLASQRLASSSGTETFSTTADAGPRVDAAARFVGTAVPEVTAQAMVPFVIALGLVIVTAIGFQTPDSRQWLVRCVVANAAVMTTWGIVHRTGSDVEILPAIAGLFALSMGRQRRNRTRHDDATARRLVAFGISRSQWSNAATLATVFVAGILVCGIAASSSRGVWLSLAVAAFAIAPLLGVSIRNRNAWLAGAGLIALIFAASLTTGIADPIETGTNQRGGETVASDQRWNHWHDGLRTAIAHLPAGSGLGTFGDANLPFQSSPRSKSFRDAENQFLEVLTESGIVGIAILISGIVWFSMLSIGMIGQATAARSSRQSGYRETLAWGVLGLSLVCFGVVQSSLDLVLKVPANLFLYAILVSAAATFAAQSRVFTKSTWFAWPAWFAWPTWPAWPVALALVTMVMTGAAMRLANRDRIGDAAIAATSLSRLVDQAAESAMIGNSELDAAIAYLDDAIAIQPMRWELRMRRAHVELLRYRLALIATASEQGLSLTLDDTRLSSIHAVFMSQNQATRTAIQNDFISTPPLRRSLGRVIDELGHAVALNPYAPQSHFQLTLLSPLADLSTHRWLQHSARLANSDHQLLFDNGLIAFYSGDNETMLDQWEKSTTLSHQYLQTSLDLAVQRVPVTTVAQRLVPGNRPDRLIDLFRRQDNNVSAEDFAEIMRFVETADRFDIAQRHATLATLLELQSRTDDAIEQWRLAAEADGEDANIRLALAMALQKTGRYRAAIDAAAIGQRQFPTDDRFGRVAETSRRRL